MTPFLLKHTTQEESICALHHLIVSSYMDVQGRTIFFLRRRHPAAVALACLATTLMLSKNVLQTMPLEGRLELLRDVAVRLGVPEMEEDDDWMMCPVPMEYREPYVKAMEYLELVMWDLQETNDAAAKIVASGSSDDAGNE